MGSKEEFFFQMDLHDLENAGAFIEADIWDKFIIKASKNVVSTPVNFARMK